MENLIEVLANNGIGVLCVFFLAYFINTTMKDNNKILDEVQKTLVSIKTTLDIQNKRIEKIEDKVEK